MNISKIEISNALLIFALLGLYFLALDAFGLSDIVFLRLFNGVIVLFGLNRVIQQKVNRGETGYFSNFGSALTAALISILLSIAGLVVYIELIRGPESVSEFATSVIVGSQNVDVAKFCAALLIEGLSSSSILAFILMQWWKNVKGLKHLKTARPKL